ncbi:pentapeptide repeat-containing protein [Streptomyces sp. Tue6028]|uniref:pentapeptide repeat-containing protein n=1 Tax=Streptomyces sp. Tue6028 TaxID=2036037 RepID=UPI003D736438
MSDEQPAKKPRPWWHWALAAAGISAFIVALIWGPWWIEGHHLRDDKGQLVSSAGIIVTGFRTMLIAIAAGFFTAAGLWYTHRSHQHAEELFEHTRDKDREQARLTLEGQVTGRYVEAVKLLASNNLHERLGGIYSLDRIMKDSLRDHPTVVEVLSAFLRTKLQDEDNERSVRDVDDGEIHMNNPLRALPEDVKAALTVLTRRDLQQRRTIPTQISGAQLSFCDLTGWDWRWVNLSNSKLKASNLARANLEGAILDYADLPGADLEGARLTEASLERADLTSAYLVGAVLLEANLIGATLTEAQMENANLSGAHMAFATLTGAKLGSAHLEKARLLHAGMERAQLPGADLSEAKLLNAKLRHAEMYGAKFVRSSLDGADLEGASLQCANFYMAQGLEARQLAKANIYRDTVLPAALADDAVIQDRIEDCEEQAEALEEQTLAAAIANEEYRRRVEDPDAD